MSHDVRADGHLEGRIGLGSWRTAVEYTGVRVTTLSGTELYLSGFLTGKRFVIIDRDPKYSDGFRNILDQGGVKPVHLPTR